MKKNIVFCTQNKFPFSDAGSTYYKNFSTIFSIEDYDIHFVGIGNKKDCENCIERNYYFYSIRKFCGKTIFGKIINHLFEKTRLINFVFNNFSNIEYLFLDSSFSISQYEKIYKLSQLKQIKQVCIFVLEQYAKSEFKKLDPSLKIAIHNNNNLIKNFSNKNFKIFTISSFLYKKFLKNGFDAFVMPFTYSKEYSIEYSNENKAHEKINLLYSGTPNNKDNLEDVVKAFLSLDENIKSNLRFTICGVTKEWLLKECPNLNISNFDGITFYGRKDKKFVLNLFEYIDFTILFRNPNEVFTKAGFPTKVSESLACGVPVISNITSDLGLYLNDENSIIIINYDIDSVKYALTKASQIKDSDLTKMKKAARNTSLTKLEISLFKDDVLNFIEK